MTKHTPGPWIFNSDDWSIRSKCWGTSDQMGDYRGVIVCDFDNAHGNRAHAYDEAKANARLIAAAPELLEALKGLVEHGADSPQHIAAERAIAKATGE